MKKFAKIIFLSLVIFSNVSAESNDSELNNLFNQLKNSENVKAMEIENKKRKIWMTHPSDDRRGVE
jgi:hypothetical protein